MGLLYVYIYSLEGIKHYVKLVLPTTEFGGGNVKRSEKSLVSSSLVRSTYWKKKGQIQRSIANSELIGI